MYFSLQLYALVLGVLSCSRFFVCKALAPRRSHAFAVAVLSHAIHIYDCNMCVLHLVTPRYNIVLNA